LPAAPPKALAFPSAPDVLVAPRRGRGRTSAGKALALAALALCCVGAAVGGGAWLYLSLGREEEQPPQHRAANFRFPKPGREWRPDRGVGDRLSAQMALSRQRPRSHMALLYRDYRRRSPSEAELLDEALKRLRTYFKPLDYEDPFLPENQREPKAKLGGQPAFVLEFAGTDGAVEMRGQCYLMTYRGYGYWFFTWGPAEQRPALEEGWAALRRGFQLLNDREGWKEQPRQTVPFDGSAVPYRLDFAKDLWHPEANPKDYDDKAELWLRGFEPVVDEETGKKTRVEHAGRAAHVVVLVLPKAPDLPKANQAALDFLLQHKKEKEEQPGATLAPAKDPRTDKPVLDRDAAVGAFRGHLSKLRIEHDKEHVRFALLGVVHRPEEGVLVVFCECPWERRDFWEREFQLLVESVRPRSGPAPKARGARPARPAPAARAWAAAPPAGTCRRAALRRRAARRCRAAARCPAARRRGAGRAPGPAASG
jgi:hypothetical protein